MKWIYKVRLNEARASSRLRASASSVDQYRQTKPEPIDTVYIKKKDKRGRLPDQIANSSHEHTRHST